MISLLGTDKDPVRRRPQVSALTCSSLSLRRFCRSSISASARIRSLAACAAFLLNLSVSCNSYWDRERYEKGTTAIPGCPLHFFLPPRLIPLLSSEHLPGYPHTRGAKSHLSLWAACATPLWGQVGTVLHRKEQGLILSSLVYSLPRLVSLWIAPLDFSLLRSIVLIALAFASYKL